MHNLTASVLINASAADCYQHWLDVEKFPQFMRHVVSVQRAHPSDLLPEGKLTEIETDNPQKDYEGVMVREVAREIEAEGNQVWRWEVRGLWGQVITWTAGLVLNLPNKAISWVSSYDEGWSTSGTVNFLPGAASAPGLEKTLVEVNMSISAPGGAFGELLADALHVGDGLLRDCMADFKSYVEREVHQQLNPSHRNGSDAAMLGESELRQKNGTPTVVRTNTEA